MRTLDPWERQPYDTDDSWPVFQAYRDQTPPRRGLLVCVKGRPVDPIAVSRWYRDHYWAARVAEYDRHLDSIRREHSEAMLAKTHRDAAADRAALIESAKEVAFRELEKLLATVKDSSMEVLKPRELTRLMDMAIKLDRLERGEATETIQVDGPNLEHLTDAQLEALDRIIGDGGSDDASLH